MDFKVGEILIGKSNGARFEILKIYIEDGREWVLLRCKEKGLDFPVETETLRHMNIEKEVQDGA